NNVSMDNIYIKYSLYVILVGLFFYYVIVPIIGFTKKPSIALITDMNNGDIKTIKKLSKYYIKIMDDNEKLKIAYKNKDFDLSKDIIIEYIDKKFLKFDQIINRYALAVTTTVILSPNSLIDGLAVVFANSKMLHELSNQIGLRYEFKEIFNLYIKVFFAGTITGAIEEYDEVMEDIVEEILEGFNDNNSGKVVENVPYVSILTNSISPIIQASSNYFFITYNGYCFKNYFKYTIDGKEINFKEIKKNARKEARKKRYEFLKNLPQKFLVKTGSVLKEKSISGFYKIKGLIKK
ncbi:MAG: DUF697 domain-containing protein, partial [Bacillota bacterium]|nr:DUF697 domain-containing protein [Bacillota bacterium]